MMDVSSDFHIQENVEHHPIYSAGEDAEQKYCDKGCSHDKCNDNDLFFYKLIHDCLLCKISK